MFSRLLAAVVSPDLAVDLGTANTLVYARGHGIVVNEPSVIAIDQTAHTVLAVGHRARAMLGRTPPSIVACRPLKDGVIADFDLAEAMLQRFIMQAHRRPTLVRPRVVVAVPSGITQVEKRAIRDAALQAGARAVFLIEQPIAAALGAGLPIREPRGRMIVDIGGGTTEVAVLAASGTVECRSIRVAGDEMDEAVVAFIKKHYNLLIGERQAEAIKITLGSASPTGGGPAVMEVKGRDLVDGIPKTIVVTSDEVREALRDSVLEIVEVVRACLERTPPELAGDLADTGIVLTGGGALLRGIDQRLGDETHLPVTVPGDPLSCVARGAGRLLEDGDLLTRVTIPV